jgi:hypothetical protein
MYTFREKINVIHIFIVSILFLYIGITGKDTPKALYYVLLVLGILVVIGHTYFLIKRPQYKKFLYIIHVFIVAPLLFALYYYKEESPEWLYDVTNVLGVLVLLYHGFKFSNNYNIKVNG